MSARPLGQSRARLAWRSFALALLGLAPVISPASASGIGSCEQPFVFPDTAVNVIVAPYEFAGGEARDPDSMTNVGEAARDLARALALDTVLTARYQRLGVIAVLPLDVTAGVAEREKCTADSIVWGLLWRKDKYAPRPGQALIVISGLIYQEGEELFLQTKLRSVHFIGTSHGTDRSPPPRCTHSQFPGRRARGDCFRRYGLFCIPTTLDHEVGPESDQRYLS